MTATHPAGHKWRPFRLARPVSGKRQRQPVLLIEQQLGHRTHGLNLKNAAAADGRVLHVVDIGPGRFTRIPWSVRGSVETAWKLLRRRRTSVAFVHTQTIGLLLPALRIVGQRYIVSVDATPLQYDRMGSWYHHQDGPRALEWVKRAAWSLVFRKAERVVCWSDWAADSVVTDYGVSRERTFVAHPGAPAELFAIDRSGPQHKRPRILFVGGDFNRKGGQHLLAAFESLSDRAELTIVTEADIPRTNGVSVVTGVRPGTERFIELYADADIFCLPTLGDCTPVALGEALAAGLPVVTTNVGSNYTTVRDGATGFIIGAGDSDALRQALERLVDSAELRRDMGRAAREDAQQRFHAGTNATRIFDLLNEVAR